MKDKPSKKRSHWPISILSSVASLVNLFMPLVLVRLLTADQVGIFKIFFLYLTMVPAFSLVSGFLDGVAYWSGQAKERSKVALQMSSFMMFSVGLLFALLGILANKSLSDLLGWPTEYTLLFSISLFGAIAGSYLEEAVITRGKIWFGAIFFASFEIIRALLIVGCTILYPEVYTVFLVHALISTTKTLAGLVIGYKFELIGLEWDSKIFKEAIKYALPVSLAWMFGIFVNHADQFILSLYIPVDQFAYYTIGCLLIPPLFVVEHSICRVMIPQLSEAFAKNDYDEGSRLYREASENIAFLIIPAVTGLFIFADPIIEMLFTSAYSSAADYLQIFAFSYLVLIIPFDAVARARAVSKWLFKSFVIFSFFSILLTLAMVYVWGTFGALAALLIVRFSMRIYSIGYMRKSIGWTTSDCLPLYPLFQFVSVSLTLGIVALIFKPLFTSQIIWFLTMGAVFTLLYFTILSFWKVRRRESNSANKVLLLLPTLGIGGMERMVLNLARELQSQGWEVFVFAYDVDPSSMYPNLEQEFIDSGVTLAKYGKKNKSFFAIQAVLQLARFINNYDIRLIHSHNLGSLIHASLVKITLLHPLKLVHTQHTFVHLEQKSRYRLYEKVFSNFADLIVCVSEPIKQQYIRIGIAESKLLCISNGVQTIGLSQEAGSAQRRSFRLKRLESQVPEPLLSKLEEHKDLIWLLNLARIDSIKGQMHLLDSWNELPTDIKASTALLFVGPESEPGVLKKLQERIDQSDFPEQIILCGPSSSPELWYQTADIAISASTFEGMPLGPIEAMAHGLPCVLSDIDGHRFLGDRARYFSLKQKESLTSVLKEILSRIDSEDYLEEQKQNSKYVVCQWGVEKMADNYMQIYRKKSFLCK